ncbi:MAG: hypothetical protein ACK5YA_01140 [bacterium]|jgi:hypothetical protein
MYTYHNINNFNDEQDFLLKFVEKKESSGLKGKSKLKTRTRQAQAVKPLGIYSLASNTTFFLNFTAHLLFGVIDVNSDNYIDWYDYAYFYQVVYLFNKFDPYQKGKILASEAFEKYSNYYDFPRVSINIRERARRFNLLNQDLYLDVFSALVILRIDDIVDLYTRKTDKSLLYEVELKRIFAKVNLRFINDGLLNRCLRGMDFNNVPKYDWECAFMTGITQNLNYLESASLYNTAQANNITLANTVFYNVDATLLPPAPPKFF